MPGALQLAMSHAGNEWMHHHDMKIFSFRRPKSLQLNTTDEHYEPESDFFFFFCLFSQSTLVLASIRL